MTGAAAGVERDEYGNIKRIRVSARAGTGLALLREALAEAARVDTLHDGPADAHA